MRVLAVTACALALGACVHLPPQAALPPLAPEQTEALAALQTWQASGRLAVKATGGGWNASFAWREVAGHSEVDVHGPFGVGATHITRSAERIRIDSGRGEPIDVPAPFTTLEPTIVARLGVALPVDALRFWLLGVPSPDAPSTPTAGGFEQAGWAIEPGERETVQGAPAPLPHLLTVARDKTRIRVVIDHWELGGA
jgi:outer membrane lipoprotein LolB